MRHSATGRTEPGRPVSRQIIEDEIERLIGLLDALDADPDLEPDCDAEPSLCGPPGVPESWRGCDLECDEGV